MRRKSKAKPKPKASLVVMHEPTLAHLRRIQRTGLFGQSLDQVVETLMYNAIRDLVTSGKLDTLEQFASQTMRLDREASRQ